MSKELSFTGLGLHIKVKDIERSRRFYESLGFKPIFGYGDDAFRATLPEGCASAPERYRGVTYGLREGVDLEIAEGHIAVKPEVFSEVIASAKISGMIKVASILPVLESKEVEIKFPVRRYYWGTIEVALRDPDGFVLVFIAPDSEEEYAAVSALVPVETVTYNGDE